MIPYYPTYQAPSIATQRNDNSPVWVQGETAAKSYLVAPNSSVFLMDSERNTFYIKSADASGMPLPLRIFDYTERAAQSAPMSLPVPTDAKEYITREEFEKRIAELSAPKTTKKGAKEVDE